jgi:hypothetical protein
MKKRLTLLLGSTALAVLLSACSSTPKEPENPYTPAEELLLQQIEADFHKGEYKTVIDTVKKAPETSLGGMAFRTDALKLKAFSECVSRQQRNCRNTFRQLLELNPEFNLKESESSHPQWGKVFATEKKRSDEIQAKAEAGLETPSTMPRAEIRVGPRQRTTQAE